MFGLFKRGIKRGFEYNVLATSFTDAAKDLERIQQEIIMSREHDPEFLIEELIILAHTSKMTIMDVIRDNQIGIDEKICIPYFGGFRTIKYCMDGTVARIVKLATAAGIKDKVVKIMFKDFS